MPYMYRRVCVYTHFQNFPKQVFHTFLILDKAWHPVRRTGDLQSLPSGSIQPVVIFIGCFKKDALEHLGPYQTVQQEVW
jgi:hypothetical protein